MRTPIPGCLSPTETNLPVGRIAGDPFPARPNRKYGTRNLRCRLAGRDRGGTGFPGAAGRGEAWAGELGMETITGPHGVRRYSIPTAMLVEGFDKLCTQSGNLQPPYYPGNGRENAVFARKSINVEFLTTVPTRMGIPAKAAQPGRSGDGEGKFRLIDFETKTSDATGARAVSPARRDVRKRSMCAVPLTPRQIDYYVKKYHPLYRQGTDQGGRSTKRTR